MLAPFHLVIPASEKEKGRDHLDENHSFLMLLDTPVKQAKVSAGRKVNKG